MKPAEVSTPSDQEVLIKRSFDAPADLVWRAYTEPDLMRRWLTAMPGWSMPVCEMTTDVGGKYRWRWRDDENNVEFGFTGEMLEVEPHSKIVHTQVYDPGSMGGSMGDGASVITVMFDETDGITNVSTLIKKVRVERGSRCGGRNRHDRRHGNELQAARCGVDCRGPHVSKGLTYNVRITPLLRRGLPHG